MKERPILFSAPMVRAILEGRKTVTRRVVKFPFIDRAIGCELAGNEIGPEEVLNNSPYGVTGQRLWVRETWGVISHSWDEQGNMIAWVPDRPATKIREMPFGQGYYSGHVIYAADGPMEWAGDDDGGGEPRSAWKPSIHMPRTVSRILLEITAVRVERLQGISVSQALAEGVCEAGEGLFHVEDSRFLSADPRESFALLWDSINEQRGMGWQVNPWVWVLEFKRVERGE